MLDGVIGVLEVPPQHGELHIIWLMGSRVLLDLFKLSGQRVRMLRELLLACMMLGLGLGELAVEPGLLSIKPLSITRVHVGCRLAGRIPISMGRGEGKRSLIHLELQLLYLSGGRGKLGVQQCLGRPLSLELSAASEEEALEKVACCSSCLALSSASRCVAAAVSS